VIPGLRNATWFAQVVDGAGNVTYVLDKGKFFQATYEPDLRTPIYDLYLPIIVR
jgi:hypothetical protein